MTQLEIARRGDISEGMKICAEREGVTPEFIRKGVEEGNIVVVRNNKHTDILPLAIGKGVRTKINANIGTSKDLVDLDLELKKVEVAEVAGADFPCYVTPAEHLKLPSLEDVKEGVYEDHGIRHLAGN